MKLLVCFQAAPKVEMLLDEDWVVDKEMQIDTSFVRSDLGSHDESALELALKLSDASQNLGIPLELSALTVDGSGATPILKTLNALQFASVVRIEPREDLLFRPMGVASIISQYIGHHALQDAVILGRQSDMGENAKTPLLTAEMLGWPCLTQAVGIEPVDAGHLSVTRQDDDGHVQEEVRPPCVITIGDAPCTYLRKPTLRDRLTYGRQAIAVLPVEAFHLQPETETLAGLEILRHERAGQIIDGRDPADKARKLYAEHLEPMLSGKKGVN